MTSLADLHIHTHYSDSTSSPQEVVEQSLKAGLGCIAITDHDTIDGIAPTIEAAAPHNLEVLPGVELSSEMNGKDIHILGYLFDFSAAELRERLSLMQNARVERMKKMIEKLRSLGVNNIELEEVTALAQSKSVGRPHLAQVLLEKGCVTSLKAAFDRYLDDDGPAYVPKLELAPSDAIGLIRQFGGVAVLAHPMLTLVDELIPGFVEAGLGGLEVNYPNVPENIRVFYKNLAEKYGLAVTGGSDAHGNAKKHTWIGKTSVPYRAVEELKKHAQR